LIDDVEMYSVDIENNAPVIVVKNFVEFYNKESSAVLVT
jgi:hypothetical protein